MQTITSFPYEVNVIEHILIPLPDGDHLAAKLWLPKMPDDAPVPAIFEYIPYRKRDMTRNRDSITHGYLAGHGFACIRVDLRGSGESDGVMKDQYRPQELQDAVTAIEWIAEQAWCTGSVGMMGISWGGFNSLQVAALRPEPLKAIITVCSTDDLYADNMHYMGGCLLTDNLSEATTMFSINTCPPDPQLVGESWREMWKERLDKSGHWLTTWLEHQQRDEYWRHGSVNESYEAIDVPVMAVGGWADGYTNAIFRLLANLNVPRLGLVGPWGHKYPHMGEPGPAIGFLQESMRWWDQWLNQEETGIMEEPMLRAWMQESVTPTTSYETRPGRWVAEASWPSSNINPVSYPLSPYRIEPEGTQVESSVRSVSSPLSVGLFAGKWCSYTYAPDLPHDQREEDGGALLFTGRRLEETVEIMGAPTFEFEFSVDQPVAMVAVRLSDVSPDDKATRVTYGLLNLCHVESQSKMVAKEGEALDVDLISGCFHTDFSSPNELEPGRRYRARVQMNQVAQTFPKGNRLRISISTSYWPLAWASPKPVRLTVFTKKSRLILPERSSTPLDETVSFELAEGAEGAPLHTVKPPHHNWLVHRDLAEDISTLEVIKDVGTFHLEDIDIEISSETYDWYSFHDYDFSSLRGETQTKRHFKRDDWDVTTKTRTVLTCDTENFYFHAELDAYEGEKRILCKNWDETVPRKFL